MKTPNNVVLYTDGSTWPGNPGHGGWGAALMMGERVRVLSGCTPQATNNYMETMAVLMGLSVLKYHCRVKVATDSMYVVNGLLALKKGRLLKTNTELWAKLQPLYKRHDILIEKVPGHSDDPINEWVDALAGDASELGVAVDAYSDVPEKFIKRCERRRERKRK